MMKRIMVFLIAAMLAAPCIASASDIEEFELGNETSNMSREGMPQAATVKPSPTTVKSSEPNAVATTKTTATVAKPTQTKAAKDTSAAKPATAQKKLPAKTVAMEPRKGSATKPAATKEKGSEEPVRYSSAALYDGREGRFQVGFVGPGFGVANKGIGPMMTMGLEGEYFFWEHLSAGLRVEVASEFKDHTILSFVPRARYVFDFDSHPRWHAYVQGGVGLALYNAKHAAADISIPGGGFWWNWTDKWSVGADTNFHILVRSDTAFEWTISPAIRYIF